MIEMDRPGQRATLKKIIEELRAGTYDLEKNKEEIILLVKHAAWARLVALDTLEKYSHDYLYRTTEKNEEIPKAALPRISKTGHKPAQDALLKMPELYEVTFSPKCKGVPQYVNRLPPWRIKG